MAPDPKTVAEQAIARFHADYPDPAGAQITVVIPALDEGETVASVVAAVPARVCDLTTEVLVVDDGSSDETAARARAAGALVCRLVQNCGQGWAFRIGYRLARERGSAYIATLDADGQFDPTELATVMGPLVAGEADFVNGSRRLGHSYTTDPVRRAGVVFFSRLISVLTGVRVTDPANGLRAFRSELTAAVPLRQSQYQTAEFLIGVIGHGFRVLEVPATMYPRAAGESKKGRNAVYALRFGRVVVKTWWQQIGLRRLRRRPIGRGPEVRSPPP